jgi:hypothetical protein
MIGIRTIKVTNIRNHKSQGHSGKLFFLCMSSLGNFDPLGKKVNVLNRLHLFSLCHINGFFQLMGRRSWLLVRDDN